jgi:hypothetical protein
MKNVLEMRFPVIYLSVLRAYPRRHGVKEGYLDIPMRHSFNKFDHTGLYRIN